MKSFIVGLLLCSSSLYAADYFPPQFTAEYKLYAEGWTVGKGTRTLTRLPDGKFKFETIAKSTGFLSLFKKIRIEERSIFMRTKTGKIRPLEYSYRQTGSQSRTNQVLFDWSKGIAKNTFKGKTKIIPLEDGTFDRLLYQLVLMLDLNQGKRKIRYLVVDKGKIKVYTPRFIGKERIDTGIGELKTVKYVRESSSNNKRRTTLWCARALHYLPVQVEHVEADGDVFSMVLQSVRKIQ
ncbi:MAG: DUF3108 domain-containing protein [Pseudomonadota bacterium]